MRADAYRSIKPEVPGLQPALAGSMAPDDPEGWEIYREVQESAKQSSRIHPFANLAGVGNIGVDNFQRPSEVVIQESIRGGLGLVLSEGLWKGIPIAAGRAGGIPLQVRGGIGGLLMGSVGECAEKTLGTLQRPEEAREFGVTGRELVGERFLPTRLIADDLRLYGSVLGTLPHKPGSKQGSSRRTGTRRAGCGSAHIRHRSARTGLEATASVLRPADRFEATPQYSLRAMSYGLRRSA